MGIPALAANAGEALMLYRFRAGDANMRSVWICSRNDAIGNVAVVLAAAGVLGTGTGWPDLIVAGLGLWGGWQMVEQARAELRAMWLHEPPSRPSDLRRPPSRKPTTAPHLAVRFSDRRRSRRFCFRFHRRDVAAGVMALDLVRSCGSRDEPPASERA